jgi:hypothetical protein
MIPANKYGKIKQICNELKKKKARLFQKSTGT